MKALDEAFDRVDDFAPTRRLAINHQKPEDQRHEPRTVLPIH
jgi:hypothetical protein